MKKHDSDNLLMLGYLILVGFWMWLMLGMVR